MSSCMYFHTIKYESVQYCAWIILQLVHRPHSLLVQPGPDVLVEISAVILHIVVLGLLAAEILHWGQYSPQLMNWMLLFFYVIACIYD